MKTSNVFIAILSVAVGSVAATLHTSGVAPWLKATNFPKTMDTADVVFKVDETQGKLVITSGNGPGCNKKGCFRVTRGRSGRVKFKFEEGLEWQLTKFQICKGATKNSTQPCNLGVWERMEFAASDAQTGPKLFHTKADGIIDLTGVKPGTTQSEFYLFDQNAIRKMYFYKIEACKVSTGTDAGEDEAANAANRRFITTTCYTTDPPIDNGGRF